MLQILNSVPWPVFLAIAAGLLFLAWRYFGERGVVAAALALLYVATYRKGREDQKADRAARDASGTLDSIRRGEEVRRESDARNADPDALREDDGFKRKDAALEPIPTEEIKPAVKPKPLVTEQPDDGFKRD